MSSEKRASAARQGASQEVADERTDLIRPILQREVAGIDQVKLGCGIISQIGLRACGGKYLVACAPDDERGWSARSQKRLKLGIQRDVRPVVIEQIQLNLLVSRALKQRVVVPPRVGIDAARIVHAVQILPLDLVQRERLAQGIAVGRRVACPLGLYGLPEALNAVGIGISVLDDQARHALRMTDRQPQTYGGAVILDVDRVAIHPQLTEQSLGHISKMSEGVGEPLVVGRAAVTEARIALGVVRWIIELPEPGSTSPGRLILDPTDDEVAGFTRRVS